MFSKLTINVFSHSRQFSTSRHTCAPPLYRTGRLLSSHYLRLMSAQEMVTIFVCSKCRKLEESFLIGKDEEQYQIIIQGASVLISFL